MPFFFNTISKRVFKSVNLRVAKRAWGYTPPISPTSMFIASTDSVVLSFNCRIVLLVDATNMVNLMHIVLITGFDKRMDVSATLHGNVVV